MDSEISIQTPSSACFTHFRKHKHFSVDQARGYGSCSTVERRDLPEDKAALTFFLGSINSNGISLLFRFRGSVKYDIPQAVLHSAVVSMPSFIIKPVYL